MKKGLCFALAALVLPGYLAAGLCPLKPEWTSALESLVGDSLVAKTANPRRLLVFYRTEGYCHAQSIVAGNEAIRIAGEKANAWRVDFSDDYAALQPDNLAKYDAVVLNNTTNLKTDRYRFVAPALVDFVKYGKGLAVIHSGDDGFSEAPDILYMIGGRFCGHPWGSGGTWRFKVEDPKSPLAAMFPKDGFRFSDEIYMQSAPYFSRQALHVLVSLDLGDPDTKAALDRSNMRRRPDNDYAVAWVRGFGRGRVFYTSFGHDERAWLNGPTLKHILGGIQYALRDVSTDETPSEPQFVKSPFAASAASARYAAPHGDVVKIWPEGKMPVVSTNQTYAPFMEFFRPEKQTTDAFLIVTPGGGYGGVAYDGEGYPVQRFCMEKGMGMAILKYRTPRPIGKPMYLSAWQDVQRAIRVARSQAKERGYSPDKIGVMGFSAGGHLTLMAATSSLTPAYDPVDELDKLSCSPNWAVPVYPAYVLEHDKPGMLMPEFKFDAATPRMCLMHGDADVFPADNSVTVYSRLRSMKIPAEIHTFLYGDHVFFRTAHADDTAAAWLETFWRWLYSAGIRTPHPSANEKGAKRVIFGPIEKMGTYEKDAWRRQPQDELVAYKDSPFWLADEYGAFEADFEYFLGDKAKWIRRTVRVTADRVWVAENDEVVYDGPHVGADIWPFLRKPGKGLAEPGPLGIAATRDGRLLTMRILRTRK